MATGISFSDGLNGWTVVEQRYSWDTTTATLAYKIGQRNGMQEGTKVANWLEAERELTGRGGLVRTSEVGVHWEFFDDPHGPYDVSVVNSAIVFALCRDYLLRSGDGGRNWTAITINKPSFPERYSSLKGFWSVKFLSASTGWATAYLPGAAVFATSDRGVSWTEGGTLACNWMGNLSVAGETVWAIGGNDSVTATVLCSKDGGVSWVKQYEAPLGKFGYNRSARPNPGLGDAIESPPAIRHRVLRGRSEELYILPGAKLKNTLPRFPF
jgi:photosystem II stability/assembly factor-like uncharacterized protein